MVQQFFLFIYSLSTLECLYIFFFSFSNERESTFFYVYILIYLTWKIIYFPPKSLIYCNSYIVLLRKKDKIKGHNFHRIILVWLQNIRIKYSILITLIYNIIQSWICQTNNYIQKSYAYILDLYNKETNIYKYILRRLVQ